MNTRQRIVLAAASFGLLSLIGFAASGESVEDLLRRYPYDPACQWGRVSNGKGLLVRCLTESEASGLKANTPAPAVAATTAPSSTEPAAPSTAETSAEVKPGTTDDHLEVSVGPVNADKGQLGIGKLGAPKDRYLKCVQQNGGMSGDSGEVQVRFLLRARGRAEGVSVAKRLNLSAEAARCVAEVVDRRYVGVPEEPLVGATVIVKFTKAAR